MNEILNLNYKKVQKVHMKKRECLEKKILLNALTQKFKTCTVGEIERQLEPVVQLDINRPVDNGGSDISGDEEEHP